MGNQRSVDSGPAPHPFEAAPSGAVGVASRDFALLLACRGLTVLLSVTHVSVLIEYHFEMGLRLNELMWLGGVVVLAAILWPLVGAPIGDARSRRASMIYAALVLFGASVVGFAGDALGQVGLGTLATLAAISSAAGGTITVLSHGVVAHSIPRRQIVRANASLAVAWGATVLLVAGPVAGLIEGSRSPWGFGVMAGIAAGVLMTLLLISPPAFGQPSPVGPSTVRQFAFGWQTLFRNRWLSAWLIYVNATLILIAHFAMGLRLSGILVFSDELSYSGPVMLQLAAAAGSLGIVVGGLVMWLKPPANPLTFAGFAPLVLIPALLLVYQGSPIAGVALCLFAASALSTVLLIIQISAVQLAVPSHTAATVAALAVWPTPVLWFIPHALGFDVEDLSLWGSGRGFLVLWIVASAVVVPRLFEGVEAAEPGPVA